MAGRRPKPTRLKKLSGLPAAAQAEWRSIVPHLLELGVLTKVDGKALAAYCCCYADWIWAEMECDKYGRMVDVLLTSKVTGKIVETRRVKNPAFTIKAESLKQMKSFLIEFGLSPASRSRLKIEKPSEVDPMEAFLAGGQQPRVN